MKERTSDDEERSKPSHGRQGTREPSQATRLALGLARRGASVSGARLRRTARVRGSGAWLGRAARVHSSGAAQAHCSGARLGRSARVHGSGAWLRRRARAALSRGSVAGFGRSIHIDTDAHTHTHMTHTRTCTHAHTHIHRHTRTQTSTRTLILGIWHAILGSFRVAFGCLLRGWVASLVLWTLSLPCQTSFWFLSGFISLFFITKKFFV